MQGGILSVLICVHAGCVDARVRVLTLLTPFISKTHLLPPSLPLSLSLPPPLSLSPVTIVFSGWNHCALLFFSVGGPCEALKCKCLPLFLNSLSLGPFIQRQQVLGPPPPFIIAHAQQDVIRRRGGVVRDGMGGGGGVQGVRSLHVVLAWELRARACCCHCLSVALAQLCLQL